MLLLTLLPLAGWAQTANWKSGAPDVTYGDATPDFPSLINVISSNGDKTCTSKGEGTSTPGGNQNAYVWKIYQGSTPIDASSTLDVGSYTLRLRIRHQNGTDWWTGDPTYTNGSADLSFSVKKAPNNITGLTMNDYAWDEKPATPTCTADYGAGSATYEFGKSTTGPWDWTWPSYPTTAGVYYTRVTIPESANYLQGQAVLAQTFTVAGKATVTGLSLATGLVYNDNKPVTLITGTPTYPSDYDEPHGGIEYIVKTTAGTPDPSETGVAAAEATNVGLYYVYYRVKADGDIYITGNWTQVGSTGVKINKAPFKAEAYGFTAPTADKKTYTGSPLKLFADGAAPAGGTITYSLTAGGPYVDADNDDVKVTDVTDATKLYYKVSESEGYLASDELSIDLEMDKATVTFTPAAPAAAAASFTYTQANQTLITDVTPSFGTLLYSIDNGTSWKTYAEVKDQKNAGKYNYKYKVVGNDNYNGVEASIDEIEIKQAQFEVNSTLADAGVVYNGGAQSILTGTIKGGTGMPSGSVTYKVGEETFGPIHSSNPSLVKETKAGTYEVEWSVTAEDADEALNWIPATGTVTATIAGKDVTLAAIAVVEKNYGEDISSLSEIIYSSGWPAGVTTDEAKAAIIADAFTITGAPEKAYPDAGNYNIVLKEKAADKKTDLSKSYVFTLASPTIVLTVNPVPATLTAQAALKTYGEADPTFVAEATGLVAGDTYDKDIKSTVTFTRAEGENFGEYKITPASSNENYTWTVGTANLTIQKKMAAVKANPASKEYGAEDPVFTAAFEGLISADEGKVEATFTREDGEDVGTYDITPAVVKSTISDNYTFSVENGKLTIGAVMASATAPTAKTLVYTGKDLELVNAATDVDGGTVQYSLDGTNFSADIPTAVNAGTYNISWKVVADGNHTDYNAGLVVPVTIAKAPVTDIDAPEPVQLLIFNGKAQTLVTAAKFADGIEKGTFKYSLDNATWADKLPEGLNAGEYTVYTQFTPDANHNDQIVASVGASIAKMELGYTLTTISNWTYTGKEVKDVDSKAYMLAKPNVLPGKDALEAPFKFEWPETVKDAKDYDFIELNVIWKNTTDPDFAENYTFKFTGHANFTIEPKELTEGMITVNPKSAPFTGDNVPAVTVAVADGDALVFGNKDAAKNDVNYTITKDGATFENGKFSAAGTYNFTFTAQNNYKGEVVVPFTVNGMSIANMLQMLDNTNWNAVTYNGKNQAPKFKLSYKKVVDGKEKEITPDYNLEISYMNGDKKVVVSQDQVVDAHDYTFKFTGKGNYSGEIVNVKKINAKALKATDFAVTEKVEYTSKDQMPSIVAKSEIENLKEGKDYKVLLNGAEITKDTKLPNFAATYVFSFVGQGNYNNTINKNFVIDPATVLITAGSYEKFYDGQVGLANSELVKDNVAWTYSGLKDGDNITDNDVEVAPGALNVYGASKNAGTYNLKVDASKFSVSDNYVFVAADTQGTLTIKKAPVTLGFKNEDNKKPFYSVSKVYGEADSRDAILSKVTALENKEESPIEDELVGLANTIVNSKTGLKAMNFHRTNAGVEEVGKYDEVVEIEYNEGVFGNYAVTTSAGNFEITEAPLTVALKNDIEVVYDGAYPAEELAKIDASQLAISGMKWNDDYNVLKNVKGIIVNDKGNTIEPKDAGTYILRLTAEADDYNVKVLDSRLIITPAPLTIAIADQTVYVGAKNEDLNMGAATIKGIVGSDDLKAKMVLNVNTAAAGKFDDGVKFTIDNPNYQIVEQEGQFEVVKQFSLGKLIVLAKEDIALDDTKAYTLPKDNTTADVTFTTRVVNEDTWNVCVLPFETTPADISDAFGYAAVDVLDDTRDDGNIHFQIVTSGVIPAGTPFIFKPSKDADDAVADFNEVTFESVKIVKSFAAPVTVENGNTYVTDKAGNKFWGTFKSTSFYGKQYWYMSKGAWKDASKFTDAKPVTVKPFRAFVEFVTPAAGRIFIEEPDGTETAIDAIQFNQMVNGEATYTLDGKKVNNVTQKGIYIKDGKKVAVK